MMINLALFLQFAHFGALCFGGGYVIIPMLYHAFVEETGFFTPAEFGNLSSLAQMTPGAVSVNSATYIGYLQNGVGGSLAATIGLVTPTLILATLAIYFLKKYKDTLWIQGILKGTRLAALAMVFSAVFIFLGMSVFSMPIPFQEIAKSVLNGSFSLPDDFRINVIETIVCALAVFLSYKTRFSITMLLFLSGVVGGLLGVFM